MLPFLMGHRKGLRLVKDVEFARASGKVLRLDVTIPSAPIPAGRPRRPALVQIHGGGWVIGDKREQGIPLLTHMAAQGWVGFNVNYRLSPAATFPDHLVDCKRAVAWIREHADDYGIDPDFICVTGGSAGGHLTALVGTTVGDPRFQPGFEEADTSVAAAVPFYGIYDFTPGGAFGADPEIYRRFLEPMVMKAFVADEPERYEEASPLHHVHDAVPPFFVVHGDRDTLAPVEDARAFVDAAARGVEGAGALRRDARRPARLRGVPVGAHGPRDRRRRAVPHHALGAAPGADPGGRGRAGGHAHGLTAGLERVLV